MAKVEMYLGTALTARGRFEEAERLLTNAHDYLDQVAGRVGSTTQEALGRIVDLYEQWGRSDEVARWRARIPEIAVDRVWDLGPVDFHEHHPQGGYSALLDGSSVWTFSQPYVLDSAGNGTHLRNAPFARTNDLDASDGLGGFPDRESPGGWLASVPLTPEEIAFNVSLNGPDCSGPCDRGWFLMPGPIVADPERDRSIVFYSPFLRQPHWEDRRAGASVAVCSSAGDACSRPAVRPGTENPTLLFEADEPAWGAAALVVDSHLHVYGRNEDLLLLARVPLAAVLDRSAWRFFSDGGRWSADWREARPVPQSGLGGWSPGVFSVHWNTYLGKYLAISSRWLDARIEIRTAEHPEGPWSDPVIGVSTKRSPGGWFWTHSGRGHPEYARDGGRIEYLTFARHREGLRFGEVEVRLVEITFK
jgi:hypothetical protein